MDPEKKIDIVDINHAELEELSAVTGIGPVLASRIITARPFDSLDDLQRVSGIGPRLLEQIRSRLTVISHRPAAAPDEVLVTPAPEPHLRLTAPAFEEKETEPQPDPWTGEPLPPVVQKEETPLEAQPEPQDNADHETLPLQDLAEPARQTTTELPLESATGGAADVPQPKPEPEKSGPFPASEPAVKDKNPPSHTDMALYAIGFSVLALILGILLTLGILRAINGSLNYASLRQFSALNSQVIEMQSQTKALQQDIDGMRSRLDALEALSGRVSNLERETTNLRSDLKNQGQKLEQLETQIIQLKEQTDSLEQRVKLFDRFLNGLKALLNETLPDTP